MRRLLLPVLFLAAPLAAPETARAIQEAQAVLRYFDQPCRDQNQDGIDDFFDELTGLSSVDVMVVFNDTGYNAATAGAQVAAAISGTQAFVSYTSAHSPYVFVRSIALSNPASNTPALNAILGISGVIGVRAYERFSLFTRREQHEGELRPGLYFPEEGTDGATGKRDAAIQIQPHVLPPGVVVYFVDSGINATGYWGIDVTVDNPLAPAQATDPIDVSAMKHGSFLRALAGHAQQQAQMMTGGDGIQFADVKVAFGPRGETTTEELTKAFDAVMAHVQFERNQGRIFDVVVNISYDTDGGIANHDIIYPSGDGPPDYAVRRRSTAEPASLPAETAGGDPCAVTLFDRVYRLLGTQYGAVICVGAGNDGEIAPFAINEAGQSPSATIVVSALDDGSMGPAPYSNYAHTPNGLNGHPDIAATGTSGAPGFGYLLQGTSVSTALTSAMAAVKLSQTGPTAPGTIVSQLIAEGTPFPPVGNKYYGQVILKLPWLPPVPPYQYLERSLDELRLTASPNPARPATRLTAELSSAGRARIEVFDVTGRLCRRLADGHASAGRQDWIFDGRDDGGEPLPQGIYFVRAGFSGRTSVIRVLLQR